ncbi:MFS family permease [Saccharothrix coeruleofusca]|uniref:MFS transporter n=1 Tax=Saccharothrix coeruleofusca TaxID=33919 RepID=UPI001AE4B8B0|nr:MFS transporter [Saccharothrix coeruleofusca]MBP2336160.1 MFS family permease [Saccharothrix coeruleofusca]
MRSTRLGPDFTRLWLAKAVSNVGDGMALAAGPLLLASLTDDPLLVGGAVFVQQLPWLLFSLVSGVFVDRLDRRKLVVVVDLARAAVVAALALAVATGHASVAVVYACLFLLGTGETLADNASGAMLPSLVGPAELPRANARLMAVNLLGNQLSGPPLGGALFVLAAALPFGLDAASFALSALLVAAVRGVPARAPAPRRSVRSEIGDALRWLWRHRVLRVIALCLCLMNVALTGVLAVLVLYARERLGLGEAGYGLLLSASAVGGVVGTLIAARVIARFGPSVVLRAGLVVETSTHLSLALARSPWVAGATMGLFGVHAVVWNVVTHSVRQREVPDELRGRVGSAYFLLVIGGSAIGALLGGALAAWFGITAPTWVAFTVMVVLTATAWRHFAAADQPTSDQPATGQPTSA